MSPRNSKNSKTPTLSEALFASIVEPRTSMHRLLTLDEAPPHVAAIALLFLSVCIAAPLFQAGDRRGAAFDYEFLGSVAMTTLMSLILCSCLLPFSVHALGERTLSLRSIAALVYCTAPITIIMSIAFIASRLYMGSFSVISFLASGQAQPNDLITHLFPYVFRASLVVAGIILVHGLRTVERSSVYIGVLSACIAVMLLLGSFILSLALTDFVYPSTSTRTIEFFAHYFSFAE
jgi:hypothetical protein